MGSRPCWAMARDGVPVGPEVTTFYKYRKRFEKEGVEGFYPRSRRPLTFPTSPGHPAVDAALEEEPPPCGSHPEPARPPTPRPVGRTTGPRHGAHVAAETTPCQLVGGAPDAAQPLSRALQTIVAARPTSTASPPPSAMTSAPRTAREITPSRGRSRSSPSRSARVAGCIGIDGHLFSIGRRHSGEHVTVIRQHRHVVVLRGNELLAEVTLSGRRGYQRRPARTAQCHRCPETYVYRCPETSQAAGATRAQDIRAAPERDRERRCAGRATSPRPHRAAVRASARARRSRGPGRCAPWSRPTGRAAPSHGRWGGRASGARGESA